MKFIHLSDLHLGKRVNEFPMLGEQEYILNEIIEIIDGEQPDGVIIAGDVYDKAVPPAEAVELFDSFLSRLTQRGLSVFVISGNHDSDVRIAFGSEIFKNSGVYLSPVYNGEIAPITLSDEHGEVRVYLLPFIKPAHVRRYFEDAEIESYTDAARTAIEHMKIDREKRNILVAHQFVTGALRSDSEVVAVGGSENVDAGVFEPFDYTALGHIHGPQNLGDRVRYCGTPLKYSFSEINHKKSVTVVELREKGELNIRTVPLTPRHDTREIKGTYDELTLKKNYDGTATDDYLHIILTDEDDVPNAMGRLRAVYPNVMKLDYDNARTRTSAELEEIGHLEKKSEPELFAEFFREQNGQPLSEEQKALVDSIFEELREKL